MSSEFPCKVVGEIDFSVLIHNSAKAGTASRILKLGEEGLLKFPKIPTPDSLLAVIDDSSTANTFTVIDVPLRKGRIVCLHLQDWGCGGGITPGSIDLEISCFSFENLVVAVYFSCDWMRALFGIALANSKSLLYKENPRNWKLHASEMIFFNRPDIILRWEIAVLWPHWRKNALGWKEMHAHLEGRGISELTIRTLQRKSKAMGLLKDW